MLQENVVYIHNVLFNFNNSNGGIKDYTSITRENPEFQYSAKATTRHVTEDSKIKQIK